MEAYQNRKGGTRSGTHQSFKKLLPVVQTPLTRILKPVGKQGPGQNPLIPNENPKAEHPSPWGQALQREARHQRPGLYQGQFKTRRDSSKLFYCYSHLKFKDPRQPSTLPKARPCGSPTCPGGRQGGWGKEGGERKGQGRTPLLLLPGLRQPFGTTHRILPERHRHRCPLTRGHGLQGSDLTLSQAPGLLDRQQGAHFGRTTHYLRVYQLSTGCPQAGHWAGRGPGVGPPLTHTRYSIPGLCS